MLLIDEVDRADDDFEAFLLELLAEASVTIPELGTVRPAHPPVVILTSNRTRDLHDALKRRCLYHWIDYPDVEREVEIVLRRVPGRAHELALEVATAVRSLRATDVQKPPGIAEAIDWVAALGCSASSTSTPPRPSARSAPSSSTARTRSSSARSGLGAWLRA